MGQFKFEQNSKVKDRTNHGNSCAWGLFDKNGQRDQLGTLNLLSAEVVLEAAKEIKKGTSVSVNWQINKPSQQLFGRTAPTYKLIDVKLSEGKAVHEDELTMNTQNGSQWDGYRQ